MPGRMGVRLWNLLAKVVAYAKEVGQDEDKADDYDPFEATTLLSVNTPRVKIVAENRPRWYRHPDFGVWSF